MVVLAGLPRLLAEKIRKKGAVQGALSSCFGKYPAAVMRLHQASREAAALHSGPAGQQRRD